MTDPSKLITVFRSAEPDAAEEVEEIGALLESEGGPIPKPKPIPVPVPTPTPVPQPAPNVTPQPLPAPVVPNGVPGWVVLLIAGGAIWMILREKK